MTRIVIAWLLVMLLTLPSMSTHAAEAWPPSLGGALGSPDGPSKPPADTGSAIEQVQAVLDAFTADIDKLSAGTSAAAAQLKALGQRIALALFGTLLVWGTIRSWVLDRGLNQLLPELVQPLVMLGLSLWAVDGFAAPVRDSIVALGDLIANEVDPRLVNETGLLQGLGSTGLQLLMTPISDGFHPFGWIACKIVAIIAAVILLLAAVVGAGMIVVAKLQTAIALVLAPVFIPWAMWRPGMFLFNAWLSFLITGAMTQTMAKIVAALTTSSIGHMSSVVESYAHHDVSIVAFGALCTTALIINFMFMSVPRLATALVGGVSSGLEGWVSSAMNTLKGLARAVNSLRSPGKGG